MLWLILSLISAIGFALFHAMGKKLVQKTDEFITAWAGYIFSVPYLLVFLYFMGLPELDFIFVLVVIAECILGTISVFLYFKALRLSDISLSVPLLNFTPLFLIFTAFLILGEFPSYPGLIGIMLIALGAYILNIQSKDHRLAAPVKAVLRSKGPLLMLLVAMIWSFETSLVKVGIIHSSPALFSLTSIILLTLIYTPLMFAKSENPRVKIKSNIKLFLILGLILGLTTISQYIAVTLTIVPYVISIKRLSVLITVFLGYYIFKEKQLKQRFIGALIMVIGLVLIALF